MSHRNKRHGMPYNMRPKVCAIQFPSYRTQLLMQIDHKVLQWKGDSSLNPYTYLTHADPHTLL